MSGVRYILIGIGLVVGFILFTEYLAWLYVNSQVDCKQVLSKYYEVVPEKCHR